MQNVSSRESLLSKDPEVLTSNYVSRITIPNICTQDSDCQLPQTCCTGFLYNQCCYEGGTGFRKPVRRSFPNITLPEIPDVFPPPIPVPV